MIILPDQNIPRARFLMPMKRNKWIQSSQAQEKDEFGNQNHTRWLIKAVLMDGTVRWKGIFYDREDADAFLFAIATETLNQQPALWKLSVPMYAPEFGEGAAFLYATQTIYTTNATWNRPADWNNGSNTMEVIGGGGCGAASAKVTGNRAQGAGGGEYRKVTNFTASLSSYTFAVGGGSGGVIQNVTGSSSGFPGGSSRFYNGATTYIQANGGDGGVITTVSALVYVYGGTGGTGGSGFNGGNGGDPEGNDNCATGGGGAAGPSGAGGAGAVPSASSTGSNGGQGGNGAGGAGGAGYTSATAGTSGTGSTGTEFDSTHGSGGGSGGCLTTGTSTASAFSGDAAWYGGGSGGANAKGFAYAQSGAGGRGIMVITYVPLVLVPFNSPMSGI